MRILVIEDSERLARSLQSGLRKLGHGVDVVHDGRQGLGYARTNPFDVIVLDLLLPGMQGLEVLRTLREEGFRTPVLILTARETVADRVEGLRSGADDYLGKPFAFDELVARLESLHRRDGGRPAPTLHVGDLCIDTSARRVTRGGRVISLTSREYALLELLASRKGDTVSRIEIEDKLYDEDTLPMSNAVASAICKLRASLAVPGGAEYIHTRRGLGYVMDEEAP